MDEIKAMNKEYASYSGAPEGATVTSRYVFRTKEESSKEFIKVFFGMPFILSTQIENVSKKVNY